MRTVADRHRLVAYHNKDADELSEATNVNDLERPWISAVGGFGEFFAISGCYLVILIRHVAERIFQEW